MRLALVLFMMLCTVSARAELLIQITEGRNDAVPIAIVPFGGAADVPENVAQIVGDDLHRSGQFKPLDVKDMLSRPHQESDIIYRDWRVIGQQYLVIGNVQQSAGGQYQVSYGLYDVAAQKQLVKETYNVGAARLRDVAHAIADKIYEQITGVKGVFATKIMYITYNRKDKYPYQLQYADADGHRVQTILRSRQPIMSPAWSPHGRKVAYVSFEDNGLPAIYIQDLATSQRKKVSEFPGINGAPAFSPDGKHLALTLSKDGNAEIYMLDMASGQLTRLTNNYAIDTEPCWMPDGRSLVFTSSRSGGPQIYKLNIDDKSVQRLTFNGKYNARPAVTPDGRYLVFVHRENGNFHIAVQDLERDTFDIVTRTELDESPSVAPNGSMVIYATQDKGKGVLEEVSIDGRVKVRLPSKEGDVREPAWSPFL